MIEVILLPRKNFMRNLKVRSGLPLMIIRHTLVTLVVSKAILLENKTAVFVHGEHPDLHTMEVVLFFVEKMLALHATVCVSFQMERYITVICRHHTT